MSAIFRPINQGGELAAKVDYALGRAINCYRDLPDLCTGMVGYSGYKTRYVINNLMRTMNSPQYVELGTWQGSTLCSAIGGVEAVTALGIDNFSLVSGSKELLEQNVRAVKRSSATVEILDADVSLVEFSGRGPFNVAMYDCGRAVDHSQVFANMVTGMSNEFVLFVQDWDHSYGGGSSPLNSAILSTIEQLGLVTEYYTNVQSGGYYESGGNNSSDVLFTDWHNGLGIFVLSK